VAKALVGHFVAPDPVAAAQVRALRQRVAELEARVLLLEAELAASPPDPVDEPVQAALV
jgi:BMFP domain-containing protein YqiC